MTWCRGPATRQVLNECDTFPPSTVFAASISPGPGPRALDRVSEFVSVISPQEARRESRRRKECFVVGLGDHDLPECGRIPSGSHRKRLGTDIRTLGAAPGGRWFQRWQQRDCPTIRGTIAGEGEISGA